MTAEGDVHALHHETGAVRAHAPGRGGGGIVADLALAAEDTATATSRAPNISKYATKLIQNRTTQTNPFWGYCHFCYGADSWKVEKYVMTNVILGKQV